MEESPRAWSDEEDNGMLFLLRAQSQVCRGLLPKLKSTSVDSLAEEKEELHGGGEHEGHGENEARHGSKGKGIESRDSTKTKETESLRAQVESLTAELTKSKESEKLLLQELTRMRREYDKGILLHEQSLVNALTGDRKPSTDTVETSKPERFVGQEPPKQIDSIQLELDKVRNHLEQTRKDLGKQVQQLREELEQALTRESLGKEKEVELASKLHSAQSKVAFLEQQAASAEQRARVFEQARAETEREIVCLRERQAKELDAERQKFFIEQQKLCKAVDALERKLEAEASRKREELCQKEKDSHAQFKAYRDLLKKSSEASESFSSFFRSIELIVAEFRKKAETRQPEEDGVQLEEQSILSSTVSSGNQREPTGDKSEYDAVLQATCAMKVAYLNEKKHREVAERNFGICQNRLDRCLVKTQRLQQQVEELETQQKELSGLSMAEYERWWDEFKKMKRRTGHTKPPIPSFPSEVTKPESTRVLSKSTTLGTKRNQNGSTGRKKDEPNEAEEIIEKEKQEFRATGAGYHWMKLNMVSHQGLKVARTRLPGIS